MDELRNLETREDLLRQMRDRQQQLSSTNRAVQDRIDRLFRDSRMMVQRYLDSGEIRGRRAAGPAASREVSVRGR